MVPPSPPPHEIAVRATTRSNRKNNRTTRREVFKFMAQPSWAAGAELGGQTRKVGAVDLLVAVQIRLRKPTVDLGRGRRERQREREDVEHVDLPVGVEIGECDRGLARAPEVAEV